MPGWETGMFNKLANDFKVGDKINVCGAYMHIEKIGTNGRDELVLHLVIDGAKTKKRSKAMLIVPKDVPVQMIRSL